MKKPLRWDSEKSKVLKVTRGVGFENIKKAIDSGGLLDTIDHPNKVRYPNQKMFVVEMNGYVYLVPFVENEEKYFLKTLYPNRKAKKQYLERKENEKKVS